MKNNSKNQSVALHNIDKIESKTKGLPKNLGSPL